MRIIGGRFKGLRLASVGKGDTAAHLRPTSDRVRESLFSILDGGRFGDPITDAMVLDLFAGTGALGLEALSRGSRYATFVENGRASLALLKSNIDKTHSSGETRVVRCDARRLPPASGDAATLVFLDPPYGTNVGGEALQSALHQGWISNKALIVWEDASEIAPFAGIQRVDARPFGQTWLTFFLVEDS